MFAQIRHVYANSRTPDMEMAEGRFRPSLDELLWKGAAGENFFVICLGCVTMGCGAGFL